MKYRNYKGDQTIIYTGRVRMKNCFDHIVKKIYPAIQKIGILKRQRRVLFTRSLDDFVVDDKNI